MSPQHIGKNPFLNTVIHCQIRTSIPVSPSESDSNIHIELGTNNDIVKTVQEQLISLGYLAGTADGIFGEQTKVALEQFQEENALEVTGVITNQEMYLLFPFSQEYALRVATVAMTNAQATDIFAPDGNTYDSSKFHSYSDTTGFYMTLYTDGTWNNSGEDFWHVDDLVLKIEEYDTYLTVSPSLIYENRAVEPSEDAVSETASSADTIVSGADTLGSDWENWVENQFSFWDGAHKELEKLVKQSLNDEKSYEHIDTTYIEVSDEDRKALVNETLANSGYSHYVEIGDLFIMTEFSAKNAFNATVKNTALGIASYSLDTITLIAIE